MAKAGLKERFVLLDDIYRCEFAREQVRKMMGCEAGPRAAAAVLWVAANTGIADKKVVQYLRRAIDNRLAPKTVHLAKPVHLAGGNRTIGIHPWGGLAGVFAYKLEMVWIAQCLYQGFVFTIDLKGDSKVAVVRG